MNPGKMKKIMYSILKEILEGDNIPNANDYKITDDEFIGIIKLMVNEGYLNCNRVSFYIQGDYYIEKSIDTVTVKGLDYLETNSAWSKIYKGIKEIRSFLP